MVCLETFIHKCQGTIIVLICTQTSAVITIYTHVHFTLHNVGLTLVHCSLSTGGLLALKYWRDGRSGEGYDTTWTFLLKKEFENDGSNVADDLKKKVLENYPSWWKLGRKPCCCECHGCCSWLISYL